MGVFSDYLIKSWQQKGPVKPEFPLKWTLTEMERYLNNNKEYGKWVVLYDHHIITSSPLTEKELFTDGHYIFTCITNNELRKIISWINKNIVLQLYEDSTKTTDIKIRIATGMLNKLAENKIIDKDYSILAHDILVKNVFEMRFELATEQLPF